jgi:ATP-dependent NAD(P)H-hydrate dehydratase
MFTYYRPIFRKIIHTCTFYTSQKRIAIATEMWRDNISQMEAQLLKESRAIVPPLGHDLYKGRAGRIGVIGGSLEYTGAPYFCAISALKVGCDLSHVFCPRDAAPVIKSYSPELIVHPILDAGNALELIKPWLPRLHVLVIGPGLGRDPSILGTVGSIIQFCRDKPDYGKPLVIDADGLFMITERPEIIRNYPKGVILTPNAIEFSRLAKSVLDENWEATPNPNPEHVRALAVAMGSNIVVVHKGASDVISTGSDGVVVKCSAGGSGRRCGGQGDLLSGSLGTFYCWAVFKAVRDPPEHVALLPPSVIAAYAGCRLTRECNQRAVAKAGRSALTTDMLEEIHPAFETLFED